MQQVGGAWPGQWRRVWQATWKPGRALSPCGCCVAGETQAHCDTMTACRSETCYQVAAGLVPQG